MTHSNTPCAILLPGIIISCTRLNNVTLPFIFNNNSNNMFPDSNVFFRKILRGGGRGRGRGLASRPIYARTSHNNWERIISYFIRADGMPVKLIASVLTHPRRTHRLEARSDFCPFSIFFLLSCFLYREQLDIHCKPGKHELVEAVLNKRQQT